MTMCKTRGKKIDLQVGYRRRIVKWSTAHGLIVASGWVGWERVCSYRWGYY